MARRKSYTNFAKASFTEVYDIQTNSDRPTIMGLHNPLSTMPYVALDGFFTQFKRYKYTGASVTVVPASTLPADPLQLSYEAGETTIDPRDMLNPILFRGCHGVDMPMALRYCLPQGQLTSSGNENLLVGNETDSSEKACASIDIFSPEDDNAYEALYPGYYEYLYYQLLTDPSWRKSNIQTGLRMNLYPLVQKLIGQTEIGPGARNSNSSTYNSVPNFYSGSDADGGYAHTPAALVDGLSSTVGDYGGSTPVDSDSAAIPLYGSVSPIDDQSGGTYYQTFPIYANGWSRLGWIPTHPIDSTTIGKSINILPRIMMGLVYMPPAYKTEFYFRVVVKHRFLFKDYTPAQLLSSNSGVTWAPHVTQYYSSSSTTATASSIDLYDTSTAEVTSDDSGVSLVSSYPSVED